MLKSARPINVIFSGIMMIGRFREQEKIMDVILDRKNFFVYGERGVGKTFLLKTIVENLEDKSVLYCGNCSTLKNMLLSILNNKYSDFFLNGRNVKSLKKLVYPLIKAGKPYFVLDHLGRVGPRFLSFFEYLMDSKISFLGVSRGVSRQEIGDLAVFLSNVEKLKVENLTKKSADELVKYYLIAQQPRRVFPEEFIRGIFHVSKGNPKIIKQMCELATKGKYQRSEIELNVKLMDLDRRIKGLLSDEI